MSNKILIDSIADKFDISKVQAKDILDFTFSEITGGLKSGTEFQINGFGKFSTATQAAKSGTMNGKAWTSPAKQVPKFKASTTLKDALA